MGKLVKNFTSNSRFGFLIIKSSILQLVSKRLFQSVHGRFGKTATMIAYFLFPTFTTEAADAANCFVAGKWLGSCVAMLLDLALRCGGTTA